MEVKLWMTAAGYTLWAPNSCRENTTSEYTMQIKVVFSADTVDTHSTCSGQNMTRDSIPSTLFK
jgi:hypothetical protein